MSLLLDTVDAVRFAQVLLQAKAVQINTKNLTHGLRARSFRSIVTIVGCCRIRSCVVRRKSLLLMAFKRHFQHAQGIAAVATAGIPYGAMLADELELPFVYVRAGAKAHGLGRQIEGQLQPKQRLVLIEDLVSTGRSALNAAAALRAAEQQLIGVVSLFSYGLPSAAKAFTAADIPLYVLCRYEDLLQVALSEGQLSDTTHKQLKHLFANE